MKILLYVLAAIGLGVMLLIGGCFGMAFFAIAFGPETPDYATKTYFNDNYGDDIRLVTRYIAEREAGNSPSLDGQLSDDIVAVIEVREDVNESGDDEYRDLLKKHQVKKGNYHSLMNQIGVAEFNVDNVDEEFLIREIDVDGRDYWICFRKRDDSATSP